MTVLFKKEALEETPPARDPQTPSRPEGARTPGLSQPNAISIAQVVRQRLVTAEFQPIVRLDTAETVAYEAYARGPADSAFATPGAMFAAAAAAGLQGELDQVAHAAAYRSALNAKLHPSLSLFVNADPAGLTEPPLPDVVAVEAAARARLRILMEVSERMLAE